MKSDLPGVLLQTPEASGTVRLGVPKAGFIVEEITT
jgi:hypothetical protein